METSSLHCEKSALCHFNMHTPRYCRINIYLYVCTYICVVGANPGEICIHGIKIRRILLCIYNNATFNKKFDLYKQSIATHFGMFQSPLNKEIKQSS